MSNAPDLMTDEYTPTQRLIMEVRIFIALKHLAGLAGEDQTGMDEYQIKRLEDAVDEVVREAA